MRILLLLVAASSSIACVRQDRMQNDLLLLKTRLDLLEGSTQSLPITVQKLSARVSQLEMHSQPYRIAEFDPASPGSYMRIDTIGGTFLVSFENATPYLDGFRVACKIGNPSYATFNGFTLHAKWGLRFKEGEDFQKWAASFREKDIKLLDRLLPGTWNKVTFVLSPAKADEFGYLSLSMDTDSVSLR